MYIILSKPNCSYCVKAKELLKNKGLEYIELSYETQEDIDSFKELGYKTFPQIFNIVNFPSDINTINYSTYWVGSFVDLENSFMKDSDDEDF